MTDQFNKLADAFHPASPQPSDKLRMELCELLRAAAGVDVAGLMALALTMPPRSARQERDRHIAALESSLRLVLAQRVPPSNPIGFVVLDHYSPGNHLFTSFSATRNTEHDWKPVHLSSEKS